MDMSGSHRIEAPRATVWAALNDPEILRQCIPGCEEVVRQSDTEMTAKVVAKVGPVSAKFAGKVTLSDLDPPNGYTISGEGSGGAAGFGKGGATVTLADDGGATLLTYSAKAQVGGKLAQIGSRLVDATARKMAEEFFARFTRIVGPPPAEAEPAAGPAAAVPAEAAAVPVAAATVVTPPPEVPLPLPAGHGSGGGAGGAIGGGIGGGIGLGGSGFYVPWGALLVVVVLLAALAWIN
ncbi:carbon monoxide dehydrogenase subunit G [Azospirillum sp. HJ39]|uniref:SRPBCC family protein n=1 Tax=Azospirillum sp. HJ39 TaxID=3159496 RepID=UPI0035566CD3